MIIEGNYHGAMEDRAEVYKPNPEIDRLCFEPNSGSVKIRLMIKIQSVWGS